MTSNAPAAPYEVLLTVHEAARWLSVSERSIRRWIAVGDLEAIRLGRAVRIAPATLERFISAGRQ